MAFTAEFVKDTACFLVIALENVFAPLTRLQHKFPVFEFLILRQQISVGSAKLPLTLLFVFSTFQFFFTAFTFGKVRLLVNTNGILVFGVLFYFSRSFLFLWHVLDMLLHISTYLYPLSSSLFDKLSQLARKSCLQCTFALDAGFEHMEYYGLKILEVLNFYGDKHDNLFLL